MKNLEEQLEKRKDLAKKTWLLDYLTKEKIVYGDVIGNVKK